jgi:putative transposase
VFYNNERPHQSLDNRTPNAVYADGHGGGARIPDYFGTAREASLANTGQRCSAAIEAMDAA